MSPSTDPGAELTGLRRRRRLIEEYPLVCALVARLPPVERGRLGRWLDGVAITEIRALHPGVGQLRFAVTGNSTLDSLGPYLRGNTAAVGMVAELYVSDFGQYREQLVDRDSELYKYHPKLTLCVLDADSVFDEVAVPWVVADVVQVLDRRLVELRSLADAFTAHAGDGLLVLNTIPLPRIFAHQLVDQQSRAALGAAWRRFGADLLELGLTNERVVCVDLDVLADDVPLAANPQLRAYARQRLPDAVLAAYANEVVHLGKSLAGRAKKCLVLDLDGTLWGGILAEDGVAGIDLGGDLEGGAFQQLQRIIRQLGSQGVLLAVCSKNDDAEVTTALRDHPEMVLREGDFVAVRANWRPKPDNLVELADMLNLSLDSFVFVDDSVFECEFVRERNPGVAVIQAAGDPSTRGATLLAESWFSTRLVTEADRQRSGSYRTERERQTFLTQFSSLTEYLAALDLTVLIGPATKVELPRLAQLSQRTNQFNLSTERLDLAEVSARADGARTEAISLAARDRFGDHGIVGAVFTSVSPDGRALVIDNFLLSCRVFSRGIESAGLYEVLRQAKNAGYARVIGRYRASAKNAKIASFYSSHGFQPGETTEAESTFVHTLDPIAPTPAHITLCTSTELPLIRLRERARP